MIVITREAFNKDFDHSNAISKLKHRHQYNLWQLKVLKGNSNLSIYVKILFGSPHIYVPSNFSRSFTRPIWAQATWSCETEIPLSTFKSYLSHVLFASLYRNCEIWIKLVSRVQISVEASLEKNVYVKNKNMFPTECLRIGYGNISDKANWAT